MLRESKKRFVQNAYISRDELKIFFGGFWGLFFECEIFEFLKWIVFQLYELIFRNAEMLLVRHFWEGFFGEFFLEILEILEILGHCPRRRKCSESLEFKGKTGYSWGTVPNLKKGTSRKYKR